MKELYSFSKPEMENFYTHHQPKDIQLLIVTPLSSLFLNEIFPTQNGKHQPPKSTNLRIYKCPLMQGKRILGGKIGIDPNSTPPFLLIHKLHFKDLKKSISQFLIIFKFHKILS